ncbi:unnamed protein product [Allacma fusca]|uniref:Uncharacterized protein n=1 Tax=Allacma fusca TaxID=39272 RepID=A0A8J2PNS4_9HEXA|nr:unnamed protein product [Allacma fusca]
MRTHGGINILFMTVLSSYISIGLAQIAKCNSQEVNLQMRGLDESKIECAAEVGQACQLFCAWKKIGNLSPTNKLVVAKFMFLIRAFPSDVRIKLIPAAMKCMPLGTHIPDNLDPACSQFAPFIKCATGAIPPSCSVENSIIFWKD